MSTYVDIHVIQSLPPSCINRDDSGSPKSAVYGSVRRLRVSSQSWKRAVRLYFKNHLNTSNLGTRTKHLAQIIATQIGEIDSGLSETALTLAIKAINAAADKNKKIIAVDNKGNFKKESTPLFFASPEQVRRTAELVVTSQQTGKRLSKKEVQQTLSAQSGIDIALFGRMVASTPVLNVDAACQVAHAISTHAAENEYDFFTAVDDEKSRSEEEDAGAGMMGTVEFSSATMYRYATVNIDMLRYNLGDGQAALRALEVFIRGFCLSMPTGKQNTFANRTVPEAVVVAVREDQPVSLVGAFEEAVPANAARGYVARSVEALARHAATIEDNYGLEPLRSFVVALTDSNAVASLGERVSFKDLPERVREVVAPRLPGQERA